ncbi:hypothetical protein ACNKHQ_18540 [Shigella flexneri]
MEATRTEHPDRLPFRKILRAERGQNGASRDGTGKRGKDVTIKVPVGDPCYPLGHR